MRRMARIVAVLVLVAVGTVPISAWSTTPARGSVGAVPADVDDFSFQTMSADYTLSRAEDGTSRLTVVETFVALFPEVDQNHGMRRTIPDDYNDQPLHPHLVSITDENGDPRPSETDSDDGTFQMTSRSDGYLHGPQTFVFTYTLEHVTWFFADTGDDEFYWDVNGVDWAQPSGQVSATLHLGPDLVAAANGQTSCYQGYQGAADTCGIATADGGATITASASDLAPYQTMTIAVGFAQGTFASYDDSYFASPWGWLQAIAGLGVVGAIAAAIVLRRTRLADQGGRPTIIAEYTPPPGVDALESAVLLGLPSKAIPAEVLEQAVRGSIRILEGPPRFLGKPRLQAQLIDASKADGDGRMLLEGLFSAGLAPGEVYEFGRTDTKFSTQAQAILKAAEVELDRRGLRRPVRAWTRAWPVLLAVASGIGVFFFGVSALDDNISPLPTIALMVLAAVAFFVVGVLVSRKPLTAAGSELRDHLKGLEVFIEWAEADRIRMLQSVTGAERMPVDANDPRQVLKLYEQLLPYAVVFGQEKEWAQHLVVLYGGGSPYWYVGSTTFDASAFSSGIASLSASASSSSSTSGGSGGGGGAGGGGGGGGGGGV